MNREPPLPPTIRSTILTRPNDETSYSPSYPVTGRHSSPSNISNSYSNSRGPFIDRWVPCTTASRELLAGVSQRRLPNRLLEGSPSLWQPRAPSDGDLRMLLRPRRESNANLWSSPSRGNTIRIRNRCVWVLATYRGEGAGNPRGRSATGPRPQSTMGGHLVDALPAHNWSPDFSSHSRFSATYASYVAVATDRVLANPRPSGPAEGASRKAEVPHTRSW